LNRLLLDEVRRELARYDAERMAVTVRCAAPGCGAVFRRRSPADDLDRRVRWHAVHAHGAPA
jgi:hypothetical protein